jgi:transcriptional regulator GlxA family with amidase domain
MRVAILAFPRVQLLDVVGPADVFSEAARQLGSPRAYQVQVLATQAGSLRGSSGLRLVADAAAVRYRGRIDTLLVAGSPDMDAVVRDAALRDWLQRQARVVRRIGSVCSGAFVLAAAGLLSGRRVTTHWNAADRLAAEYPDAQVSADSIYVKDGNLYTSAGVTAGMDLALSMVEEDHGRELALRVARELVMFLKRPGGQSQFSAHLAAQTAEKTEIRKLQEFVLANLRADLSVPALAKQARMSERNFARVFKEESRMTPAEFVEKARLDAAMAILQKENVPLKKLAAIVGYANEDGFRRAFTRRMGVNPGEYRKRF